MEQNTGMINKKILLIREKFPALCLAGLFLLVMTVTSGCGGSNMSESLPAEPIAAVQEQSAAPVEETPGAVGDVVDLDEANNDKMVALDLEAVGRSNPFVPSFEPPPELKEPVVPKQDLPKFDLVEPPMGSETDSEASKIVTTKISGIMFDKYNPSAIINIEGLDYLVRSGDVINGYKVLAISPQTVTVQLGANVYKAGVGELVTKDEGINYNKVSNLSKKFGGAKK